MLSFAPCTEETVALAKSLTDQDIDELVEQIYREERRRDDYWELVYVKDLLAVGIEPKIARPGWRIVASFGGNCDSIQDDWDCRKAGQYRPYFGTAAEIEEYKAAQQNKKADFPPHESTTKSESRPPKAES
jgi:hypothetical protein